PGGRPPAHPAARRPRRLPGDAGRRARAVRRGHRLPAPAGVPGPAGRRELEACAGGGRDGGGPAGRPPGLAAVGGAGAARQRRPLPGGAARPARLLRRGDAAPAGAGRPGAAVRRRHRGGMGVPAVANVVTGFLGSGKTTLIRAALGRGLADRRVALIVNEVADVGIDGVALEGVNVDRMLELPGGCICCTAGSRFVLAVPETVDRVQPHLIVIETSGAAEPGPVGSELSLAGVRTDAVVTVVDAEQVIRFCREHETAARQVEAAD